VFNTILNSMPFTHNCVSALQRISVASWSALLRSKPIQRTRTIEYMLVTNALKSSSATLLTFSYK